ncbi:MAG: hypothetical protein CL933_07825 [Deltaproteobacteria bacterium]|nr:hypothetical protein [Deltaproteobacteria bacterium]
MTAGERIGQLQIGQNSSPGFMKGPHRARRPDPWVERWSLDECTNGITPLALCRSEPAAIPSRKPI